jgi:hypothetical protein
MDVGLRNAIIKFPQLTPEALKRDTDIALLEKLDEQLAVDILFHINKFEKHLDGIICHNCNYSLFYARMFSLLVMGEKYTHTTYVSENQFVRLDFLGKTLNEDAAFFRLIIFVNLPNERYEFIIKISDFFESAEPISYRLFDNKGKENENFRLQAYDFLSADNEDNINYEQKYDLDNIFNETVNSQVYQKKTRLVPKESINELIETTKILLS